MKRVVKRFLSSLEEVLRIIGISEEVIARELEEMQPVNIEAAAGKAPRRSVMATMNVLMAVVHNTDIKSTALLEINYKLSTILVTINGSFNYPGEVASALLGRA